MWQDEGLGFNLFIRQDETSVMTNDHALCELSPCEDYLSTVLFRFFDEHSNPGIGF